jgi:riboflavin synthase
MAGAPPDVMFTGLIADLGSVTALQRGEDGATVEIRTPLAGELTDGDSIAVNGVCLTAMNIHDGSFQAQAMLETLTRSALGALEAGARVNLELALRVGDRLGGHVVQGHVDGIGTVSEVREEGFARVLEIEIQPQLRRYIAEKGSVAVDGVSLTVSALHEHGFAVSLIPETLSRTNLGAIAAGALVNVEVDILAKQVERLIDANLDPLGATGQRS